MRKISLAGGEAAEGCGDKKAKDATESHFYRVMPHSTKVTAITISYVKLLRWDFRSSAASQTSGTM